MIAIRLDRLLPYRGIYGPADLGQAIQHAQYLRGDGMIGHSWLFPRPGEVSPRRGFVLVKTLPPLVFGRVLIGLGLQQPAPL